MNKVSPLLRIVTIGSVDDGKSTLIGRLLFETNSIFEDQYEAIRKTSIKRGGTETDLSLLLDGLAAEREQAITIDVAYRYFSTPVRNFIVADCPGHEQYTRNMVTGASTADTAILLIDARKGILAQSRRHAYIVALLGISNIIVVINKMDLISYSEDTFNKIVKEYPFKDAVFIPISALNGDNIVNQSTKMPWYKGTTLLNCLETVSPEYLKSVNFRFPVQHVLRQPDFRGFSGTVASGTIKKGEMVTILPSGKTAIIKSIVKFDGDVLEASEGKAITLTLDRELDISRGDMIVGRNNLPTISKNFKAIICWMDESPLIMGTKYILKHTTQNVNAVVVKIIHKININTLDPFTADEVGLNDIALIEINASKLLYFDSYKSNRTTGGFILIDFFSNNTCAAGMIID